jgi:hypothetical protein
MQPTMIACMVWLLVIPNVALLIEQEKYLAENLEKTQFRSIGEILLYKSEI